MKTQIDTTKYTAHLHPGKFEGESAATEYFYKQQVLNGDGETIYEYYGEQNDGEYECEAQAELFHINADEEEAFDLPIGSTFMIREDSQGFVYGSVHETREEAEAKFRDWLGL